MDIVFIFTNFNNTSYTDLAINSILKSDARHSRIIVVDNASDEGNVDYLRRLESNHHTLEVIYLEKNIGYFPGLNKGLDLLSDDERLNSYIVIGNNDLEFEKDILSNLSLISEDIKRNPVLSPRITTMDGVEQNPHVIKKISRLRNFIYDLYHMNYYLARIIILLSNLTHRYSDRKDELEFEREQQIYQGYGACYILTPSFFKFFDALPVDSFLMYEEFFLANMLSREGFKYFYCPSIRVKHYCHAATNCIPGKLKWKYSRDAHKKYRKALKNFSFD